MHARPGRGQANGATGTARNKNPARGRVVVDCVALVRMSRYASWYAQKTMAQAMQVQAVKLSKVYTLRYRAPAVLT